tara:strand:- start:3086 stop:3667 length:582 start_codon:yes stop_codon:yes gene_type:complete
MIEKKTVAQGILSLLEEKEWQALTLHDVAAHLNISLDELHQFATSKEDLLAVIISYIEEQTLTYIDQALITENTSKEDRLFDSLFARFEAAAPHKKAIANLRNTFQGTPTLAFNHIPQFIGAVKRLAALSDIHFTGPLGALQLRGFALIYARLIYIWLEDDSPDMAKTMAATNKAVTHYIPCLFDPCKVADLF